MGSILRKVLLYALVVFGVPGCNTDDLQVGDEVMCEYGWIYQPSTVLYIGLDHLVVRIHPPNIVAKRRYYDCYPLNPSTADD
mgnify:CR=1 FL=1